jgi:hypothetical protein
MRSIKLAFAPLIACALSTGVTPIGLAAPPSQAVSVASTCTSPHPALQTSDCLRDPLLWPYPATSFWNYPVGDGAQLVDLGLGQGEPLPARTLQVEENIVIGTPGASPLDVRAHDVGWTSPDLDNNGVVDASERPLRCNDAQASGQVVPGSTGLPIARGWDTNDFHGRTPNHSSAIVRPDLTLFESQPLHVCDQNGEWFVASQHAPSGWHGDSLLTGGLSGGGSHGGSYLSAYGGAIRVGEWVQGGEIPHATKIVVPSRMLSKCDSPSDTVCDGFRWPAKKADVYFNDPAQPSINYTGDVPAAQMGSLLTVPSSFSPDALTSEPARILARSIQRYGTYVVDTTKTADIISFATEWSPNGRVKQQFETAFGFPLAAPQVPTQPTGAQAAFLESRTASLNKKDMRLVDALRGQGALSASIRVEIELPSREPMLWVADAIAGCVAAARKGDASHLDTVVDMVHQIDVAT